MTTLFKQNIAQPHETRYFKAGGRVDFVTLGSFTLSRAIFEPGWRWSDEVTSISGTSSCMERHTGIVLSGSMEVLADDGTHVTFHSGDVFLMEPGHDAWVEGNESCIILDTGVDAYVKSS